MSLFDPIRIPGVKREHPITVTIGDDAYSVSVTDDDGSSVFDVQAASASVVPIGAGDDYFAGDVSRLRARPGRFELEVRRDAGSEVTVSPGSGQELAFETRQDSDHDVYVYRLARESVAPPRAGLHVGSIEGASTALSAVSEADITQMLRGSAKA